MKTAIKIIPKLVMKKDFTTLKFHRMEKNTLFELPVHGSFPRFLTLYSTWCTFVFSYFVCAPSPSPIYFRYTTFRNIQ